MNPRSYRSLSIFLIKRTTVCLLLSFMYMYHGAIAGNKFPTHSGMSPVSFDDIEEPSGEFVVTDLQPGELDSFQFRSASPFEIEVELPITRFVGDVNEALAKGVISDQARIFIPAFDVDASTSPIFDCDGDNMDDTFMPEVDEVYFNGKLIGQMTGNNDLWKFNDGFMVPIQDVNFPSAPGEVAVNTIQVAIDVANKDVVMSGGGTGCQVWGTSIDWVGIKFQVAQPVYLLTGLFGSPAGLTNSGYMQNLQDTLGLYSKVIGHSVANLGICLPGELEAMNQHADEFIEQIKEDGALIGTAEIHLVGHSMGGVDGRMVLKKLAAEEVFVQTGLMDGTPVEEPIKPISLLSHGAPHAGTLIADYLPFLLSASAIVEDLCELSVATMSTANAALNQLNGAVLATIGSDADQNNNQTLDATELAGNQIPNPSLGNFLYSLLYEHDDLMIDFFVDPTTGAVIPIATPVPGGGPNPNDTMVTIESAHAPPGNSSMTTSFGKNHGTIIDNSVQNQAISVGRAALKWGELQ